MPQSNKVEYRGVTAWVEIRDSDVLPESHIEVVLHTNPPAQGTAAEAYVQGRRALLDDERNA